MNRLSEIRGCVGDDNEGCCLDAFAAMLFGLTEIYKPFT